SHSRAFVSYSPGPRPPSPPLFPYTTLFRSVYNDRSFSFITKTPPAAILLKRAAAVAKGSGTPNKAKVGTVTEKQVSDIAKQKLPDRKSTRLNSSHLGISYAVFCLKKKKQRL